ncbi:hypothetical protein AGMMS50268_01680 [Spirochaetia bacterium]|nr:hypothetical protein AGMMS50268_01680 [Spirochaetia bacterium]
MEVFRRLTPADRKMVLEYAALILKNERQMGGEPDFEDPSASGVLYS